MKNISEVVINRGKSRFVSVFYVLAIAALILVPSTYMFDGKTKPIVTFTAFCKIFLSAAFSLERIGTISLFDQAKVMGAIIGVGGAVPLTLCKIITIKLWSWPFLLKKGNASTYDNKPDSENLIESSLQLVAIFWQFILQLAKPPQRLVLQRNALIIFLLMVLIALASQVVVATVVNNETTSLAGESVQVGDKLPPNCADVLNC